MFPCITKTVPLICHFLVQWNGGEMLRKLGNLTVSRAPPLHFLYFSSFKSQRADLNIPMIAIWQGGKQSIELSIYCTTKWTSTHVFHPHSCTVLYKRHEQVSELFVIYNCSLEALWHSLCYPCHHGLNCCCHPNRNFNLVWPQGWHCAL